MLHETLEYMKGCRGKSCTLPKHHHGAGTGGTVGGAGGAGQPDGNLALLPAGGRMPGSVGTGSGKRKHHRDPMGGRLKVFID